MASNVLFSLFGVLLLSGPQADTTLEQQDRGIAVQQSQTQSADASAGGPARELRTDTATTPVASANLVQQDDGAAAASAGGPAREPMALHAAATPVVSSSQNPLQQIAELARKEKELQALRAQRAREDAAALAAVARDAQLDAEIDAELARAEEQLRKKKRTIFGFLWLQLTGKQHRARNITVAAIVALLIWWWQRGGAPKRKQYVIGYPDWREPAWVPSPPSVPEPATPPSTPTVAPPSTPPARRTPPGPPPRAPQMEPEPRPPLSIVPSPAPQLPEQLRAPAPVTPPFTPPTSVAPPTTPKRHLCHFCEGGIVRPFSPAGALAGAIRRSPADSRSTAACAQCSSNIRAIKPCKGPEVSPTKTSTARAKRHAGPGAKKRKQRQALNALVAAQMAAEAAAPQAGNDDSHVLQPRRLDFGGVTVRTTRAERLRRKALHKKQQGKPH